MQDYSTLSAYILRALDGDTEAFADIYRMTNHLVYSIACTTLHNTEDAKDAVSEVYLRVFKNLHQLHAPQNFIAWLTAITHRVCADRMKDSTEDIPFLLADPSSDAVEEWHRREWMQQSVQTFLHLLPEEQQRAVYYVYFRSLSIGQTAALENCPIGTIKSRLHYARKTLQRVILKEEKKSDDKLHLPLGAAALGALLMLPTMPFRLSPAEAMQIFASVSAALGMQYTAADTAPKVIALEEEGRRGLMRRYLLRFTPAAAICAVIFLTAVLAVGITAALRTHDMPLPASADAVPATDAAIPESTADIPVPASAALRVTTEHGAVIFAEARENDACITEVTGSAEHLIIPDKIGGLTVTEIADGAFAQCVGVKHLHLPYTLEHISGRAVADLEMLTAIYVSTSSRCFYTSDGVLFDADQITLIAYPNEKAGSSYTVPTTVQTIGAYAVQSKHLTELKLPTVLKQLKEYALAGCVKLEKLRIPDSLEKIAPHALDCPALTEIKATLGSEHHWWSWSNSLLSYDKTRYIRYPNGKNMTSFTLPSPVLHVEAYAFSGAESLHVITVPAAVKTVHANAFTDCDSLTRIVFEGDATEIVGGDSLILTAPECVVE